MRYILGVDPGVSGAYTVIHAEKKRIKVCELFTNFETVLEDLKPFLGNVVACIEKVHSMPKQGVKSTATFMLNAGGWEGFLVALEVPRSYVATQSWPKKVFDTQPPKKPMTGTTEKEDRKIVAENRKIKKLHTVSYVLRAMPKAKKYFNLKKDQDKADAICIALYRRIQMGFTD